MAIKFAVPYNQRGSKSGFSVDKPPIWMI